jgi:hypothetical protein
MEEEVERRKVKFYIPNWFSVEIKTGVSLLIGGGGREPCREIFEWLAEGCQVGVGVGVVT